MHFTTTILCCLAGVNVANDALFLHMVKILILSNTEGCRLVLDRRTFLLLCGWQFQFRFLFPFLCFRRSIDVILGLLVCYPLEDDL
ncbi:hypothetical protein L1987_12882 [Smallanthus sonchifolius]|uniref:Uncharacterized protein n=1 Tax=Smallanthus sonchifolius TaxID=185202 RepID=A0ACB9JFJ3_9ASTR|nr:hypothetical protein L1987_12882 [Smallanthus sonchifolius]